MRPATAARAGERIPPPRHCCANSAPPSDAVYISERTRMKRREFFGLAAAVPALAAVPIDVKSIKSRSKKVEIVYKSPHTTPNGLQATRDGMWVVDDRTENGSNYVSLINYADGKIIRDLQVPGLSAPSGLTVDD